MDLIRTTDHLQSRPGCFDPNTAPHDFNKPITNLREFKGSAPPRGLANAGHAPDQHALNRLQSTDTLPSSLITRMAKGVLATQRRQLANKPSGSQDMRIAEQYKASYVLEDRGGATAPGAGLSLRPTGKAAGGMDSPNNYTNEQLRDMLLNISKDIERADRDYQRHMGRAPTMRTQAAKREHILLASANLEKKSERQKQYEAIHWELEVRSGLSGSSSRFKEA